MSVVQTSDLDLQAKFANEGSESNWCPFRGRGSSEELRYLCVSLQSYHKFGLPRWCSGKESACQCTRMLETWVQTVGPEDPLQ